MLSDRKHRKKIPDVFYRCPRQQKVTVKYNLSDNVYRRANCRVISLLTLETNTRREGLGEHSLSCKSELA